VASTLNPEQISWSYSEYGGGASDIARIDGNRIIGLNLGEAVISGKYRNKIVNLMVQVTDPYNGEVNISQIYKQGNQVSNYLGSGTFDLIDGTAQTCAFVSPESIARDESGNIFIIDSGDLRMYSTSGELKTIEVEPFYYSFSIVGTYNGSIYALTKEWEDDLNDGGYLYALAKIDISDALDGEAQALPILIQDAANTNIYDFDISEDGKLYFLSTVAMSDLLYLKCIDLETLTSMQAEANEAAVSTLTEVPSGVSSMAVHGDLIYLGDSEDGVIRSYSISENSLRFVAGSSGNKHFVDGSAPMFYRPGNMRVSEDGNSLYLLDYNVVRKAILEDGVLSQVETVAGEVSPELDPPTSLGNAEDTTFAFSSGMDFLLEEEPGGGARLILTDPKKFMVREIIEVPSESVVW
jgi:hypothetical protein